MKPKIKPEHFSKMSEQILSFDRDNLSLAFHQNYEALDKEYREYAANNAFRDKYPDAVEHFRILRKQYKTNLIDASEINNLLQEFDTLEDDFLISRHINKIKGKVEVSQLVVRQLLGQKIIDFLDGCASRESNIKNINNELSKDEHEILGIFYDQIKENEVLFSSKIQKERVDNRIDKILQRMNNTASGLTLSIITSYHLQSILTKLPNLKKTQFDYSIVLMELHKAVEKALNALMLLFVQSQEDISTTIPGTTRSFYENKKPNWSGISIKDKIKFLTSDAFKRVPRMRDIQAKYIDNYIDILENWAQTRNRHMHFELIYDISDLEKYFKENLKVLYTLFELTIILGII